MSMTDLKAFVERLCNGERKLPAAPALEISLAVISFVRSLETGLALTLKSRSRPAP